MFTTAHGVVGAIGTSVAVGLTILALRYLLLFVEFFDFNFCVQK